MIQLLGLLRHALFSMVFILGMDALAKESADGVFRCPKGNAAYTSRTPYPMPDLEKLDLTGTKEAQIANPQDRSLYLEQDTAAGNSRLGERFLARLFGFPGTFADGGEVDAWIAQQDATNPRNRGIGQVWEKWKTKSPLLLTVMDYDTSKNLYDPRRLFSNPQEEYDFAKCVARDLAELRCANSSGFAANDTASVYFASDPNAQIFCEVRYPAEKPLWQQFYNSEVKRSLELTPGQIYNSRKAGVGSGK